MKWQAVLTLAIILLAAKTASAFDEIRLRDGKKITGRLLISSINPDSVSIKKTATNNIVVPTGNIKYIKFDREPPEWPRMRLLIIEQGHYQDGVGVLQKLLLDEKNKTNAALLTDLKYYDLLCRSKLAIGGRGSLMSMINSVNKFIKENPKSWHYYEACELIADMIVAKGTESQMTIAGKFYDKMKAAKTDDIKARGELGAGKIEMAGKSYAKAATVFNRIATGGGGTSLAEQTRFEAQILAAYCLANSGRTADAATAAKAVENIILKAPTSNKILHAKAYNVLGFCYDKAGQKKGALLAYLHVDVLYDRFPAEHAEALSHLHTIWPQMDAKQNPNKQKRADDAQKKLNSNYKNYNPKK